MKVTDLMNWFEEHRTLDDNYQHNNLSPEEFHAMAVKSWDRLTEERQVRILNIVNKFAAGLTIQKVIISLIIELFNALYACHG